MVGFPSIKEVEVSDSGVCVFLRQQEQHQNQNKTREKENNAKKIQGWLSVQQTRLPVLRTSSCGRPATAVKRNEIHLLCF